MSNQIQPPLPGIQPPPPLPPMPPLPPLPPMTGNMGGNAMAPGYTWNGNQYPMMGDMNSMMYNNQAAMGQNTANGQAMMVSSNANNQVMMSANTQAMVPTNNQGMIPSRSSGSAMYDRRRRSRSRSRSRDRENRRSDRNDDRRGSKRSKNEDDMSESSSTNSGQMNQMMGMMPGNMIPMAGGMFPGNMMMGGYAAGMVPSGGMDMMASGADGNIPMVDMMNTGGEMNMMMPMMPDTTMMGMTMGVPMGEGVKELVLKNCKLIPPAIGTPLPSRRIKPPGCRTIFIGGLPDNIKDSIVREIFERFGRISTLRLSKKNFAHIRFEREASVDMAINLSGYKLVLTSEKPVEGENSENANAEKKENAGWLHVDFALSRDDQADYERKQQRLERDAARELSMLEMTREREREREDRERKREQERSERRDRDRKRREPDVIDLERDELRLERRRARTRSPSPVARVQPYSGLIVAQIAEKIKSEDGFAAAVPTLLAWLERGECTKKNAPTFYAMIQATNGQIRRLFNDKIQCEEELQAAKERVRKNYQKVVVQFDQVAKVLTAAMHQRAWDHFTKPQRKNIETWHKMTEEFNGVKEEFNEKFGDDEDGDGERFEVGELKKIKKEKENLQVQMEAYKNEVELLRVDSKKDFEKWKAQFIASQALSNLKDGKTAPSAPPPLPDDGEVHVKGEVDVGEGKLIGVMSAFLHVHPRGASLDYVVSYVRTQFPSVNATTVRHVLEKHTDVFECSTSGVGAGIEHRWKFAAFNE